MMLEASGTSSATRYPTNGSYSSTMTTCAPRTWSGGCAATSSASSLLFIPEEYGGMGGGTFDVYRVCEQMARLDVGLATSVLATFLGSDPIFVGATPEQKTNG